MDQRPKYNTLNNKTCTGENIGAKLMYLDFKEDFMNLTQRQRK